MDGPSSQKIVIAWDGQKERPHLVLAEHTHGSVHLSAALAIRTRRMPSGREIPGWVELESGKAGTEEDSVVSLALNQLPPHAVRSSIVSPELPVYREAIADSIRTVLGISPTLRPGEKDRPRFFQYLPPHSLRQQMPTRFTRVMDAVLDRGWSPLVYGGIYRNHGWHPVFNASSRLFLAISSDEFNNRFPLPLTWVVPVIAADSASSPWILPLPNSTVQLPGALPWFADVVSLGLVVAPTPKALMELALLVPKLREALLAHYCRAASTRPIDATLARVLRTWITVTREVQPLSEQLVKHDAREALVGRNFSHDAVRIFAMRATRARAGRWSRRLVKNERVGTPKPSSTAWPTLPARRVRQRMRG